MADWTKIKGLRARCIAIALAVPLIWAALPSTGVAQAAEIRVGYTPRIPQVPMFIAEEKGFFKDEGLDVKLIVSNTASGGTTLPLLARGDLDVIYGGPSAAMFNAMNEGIRFVLAADAGRANPDFAGYSHMLVVRKDLWESGAIKTLADLKGKVICFGVRGGTFDYMGDKLLQMAGLKRSDVDIRYMPNIADVGIALSNKALDASLVVTPANVQFSGQNLSVDWMDVRKIAPDMQNMLLLFNEDFAAKRRDEASRFIRAYLKAIRWYDDQLRGDQVQLIELISRRLKLTPDQIRAATWTYFNPQGEINVANLQDQYETWVREGLSKGGLDIGRYLDEDLRKQALAKF